MTAPPDDAATDPQSTIVALEQRLDAGLAREAALAEQLAERDATLALHKTEFDERIEYQAATVDVLTTMSASPGDAQPVLDLIVRHATELCNAPSATLFEYDGELVHIRSDYRSETILAPSALAAYIQLFPMRPTRGSISCRAILDRQIVHVRDLRLDPELASFARELGHRSQVSVPLIRDDLAIGVITIGAQAAGGFSDSQVELLKTFAKQAVIAITSAETYRALQERTAALAARNSEYGERIEQQAATIDVLKVMSSSPGDAQPVFQLIVERARAFCDADQANLALLDGDMLHLEATSGASASYPAQYPRRLDATGMLGRAIIACGVVQTPDVLVDPDHFRRPSNAEATVRAVVGVPLLRRGAPVGAIAMGRNIPGEFSATQMELLKTFAEQAVIAITSAETYRALQTRTSDLQETLEYQTAISDVLKVISRSTFDLQPVLDTVAETAAKLCGADQAAIYRREGGLGRLVANFGFPSEYEALVRGLGAFPLDHYPQNVVPRAILEGCTVHIHDVAVLPGYGEGAISLGKQRTSLGVPLLREGQAIGAIVLARQRVDAFTDRQIELVSTFADQAVIAIENTRLLTEQREALEQQTATAEVLQVINASPGDLAPVFDAILEKAHTLCSAVQGAMFQFDGEHFRAVATRGMPEAFNSRMRAGMRGSGYPLTEPLLAGERFNHIVDIALVEHPIARAAVELAGARTVLAVALRKDNVLLGQIVAARREVRPFSDKEIVLLENFAAQAVIAMENARLINEQREALEQQTATAEVLQVINANPGNLAPVFDAILDKAHRLCGATVGSLTLYKDGSFHSVATHGYPEQVASLMLHPSTPNAYTRELIRGERFYQIEDIRAIEISPHYLILRALVEHTDVRTVLFVPLRKDGALLGFISVNRPEVRPFSEKEIALLENFAAQAVIAMENARLLTETREALEQQTATAEVLQVINASPGNLAPVFDAMLEKAMRLCGATIGGIYSYNGQGFDTVALLGVTPAFQEYDDKYPMVRVQPGSMPARMIEAKGPVQNPDVPASEVYRAGSPYARALVELGGIRAVLDVPLLREGVLLGFIAIYREEAGTFSDKQIALLENFAAQAVIAMENARLITEQREALEQQTATAEVLGVINRSPGDLTPVFDIILEKAMTLCGVAFGMLDTWDSQRWEIVATRGLPPALAEYLTLDRDTRQTRPLFQQILETRRPAHRLDTRSGDAYRSGNASVQALADLGGARTFLVIPLLKDDTVTGTISVYRQEVRAFSGREIALLENFAAQAVIAMENARLLSEQREALEQQTATAEVLQVINASPGNLAPVFDALLEKAIRLCSSAFGTLWTYDGQIMRPVATRGLTPEQEVLLVDRHPAAGQPAGRIVSGEDVVHLLDAREQDGYRVGFGPTRFFVDQVGARTVMWVALRKDKELLGILTIFRREVRAFTEKEVELVQSFAAQAVIAMENARLLNEVRQRQDELRITFENMGDGVAMFDESQRLIAWNGKFQEIFDLPGDLLEHHRTYEEHLRFLAARGDFGAGEITAEQIEELVATTGRPYGYERTRPDGRVIEIRRNPVPDGGFVLIFSDITERKRSEEEIRAARDAAEEASRTIEAAYRDLKAAQASLIQAEKMASLGQLTAGIAHEIKNPLNFVNNFSALSTELIDELRDVLAPEPLGETARTEVDDLTALLKGNLEKVVQHGQRADGIVRSMLDHSRGSSGERRMVDLNALIDEALNLAYHGARAQDQSFNVTLERDFGAGIASIEVNPQDMTRVLLNLLSNGFYAANKRARSGEDSAFMPTLKVTTIDAGEAVEIRVRDNGTGIPADIRDKLFQPFFTTKPTGEGTGLGLSITYDIVTKAHGGSIAVDSKVGDYSEFMIRLPR